MSEYKPYQKIMVIINPSAGKDEPILNIINDLFTAYKIDWDVAITYKAGDATRLAQEAVAAGYDLVAGYGGDGTQMEVANGMIGSDVPMAILPGGTGNAMAFELKISRELREAVRLICTSPKTQAVDIVQANGRYFMLRLYSGVEENQKTSRAMKDRYGVIAYPMSVLSMTRSLNKANYRLTIDGKVIEEDGVSCFVINAGSLGGVTLSYNLNMTATDGLLDVFMLDTSVSTLRSATGRFLNLDTNQAGLHYWRGKEIIMEADPPQTIWVDGELLGQTPVTIKVLPAAIKIVVPQY